MEKAEAREKERLKEEARRIRRLESGFKNMLKQAAPPLDVNASWDDVSTYLPISISTISIRRWREHPLLCARDDVRFHCCVLRRWYC